MPSIIPDFEYDIFISYRHNDNRSGWVTEFVNAIQEELAATIKQPLTIYFDKNPHDGLLETHTIDKSLEGKLKCLIFIPIISQTYCDPKSFAWQHEFVAFNKLVKEDQFGRDIRLSNGNVASRILPIKIHDLDNEDKSIIENEIGGALRAIEFIYKEAGVNRPLRSHEESPGKNQNQTTYRNQVNKVANAIKEIITVLKNPITQSSRITRNQQPATTPPKNKKVLIASFALLLLVAISYFLYQQLSTNNQQPPLDKSIAVLPFVDMSPAHDQEYFGDGMAEEIINVLVQAEDLKVIARTSSFQYKGKNEDLRTIGKILGVATVLEGSVRKSENLIRVTAQLIKTEDGTHLWSRTFDRKPADIFSIQDEIASAIAFALKATLSPNFTSVKKEVWNDEAMKLYQRGRFYFDRGSQGDDLMAKEYFKQSLDVDSSHAVVWAYYAITHAFSNRLLSERINLKALELDSTDGDALVNQSIIALQERFDHRGGKDFIDKALKYSKSARVYRNVCNIYNSLGDLNKALIYGKKAIESDPLQPRTYEYLSTSYFYKHNYDSALLFLNKLSELSPTYNYLPVMKAYIYAMKGEYEEIRNLNNLSTTAKYFFECLVSSLRSNQKESDKYLELYKNNPDPTNWDINFSLAQLYCARKEYKTAIDFIEKSFLKGEVSLSLSIKMEPIFDPLRADRRFIAIVEKFN